MNPNIHVIAAANIEDAMKQMAALVEQAKLVEQSKKEPTSVATVAMFFNRETRMVTRAKIETLFENLPEGLSYEAERAEIFAKDFPSEEEFTNRLVETLVAHGQKPGIVVGKAYRVDELEPLPKDNN